MPLLLPVDRLPLLALLQITDRTTVYAVIAGYLLVLVGVGLVFRRFSRDTSDYFRAGGQATWWLVGGSVFMGGFSAMTFTGAAGMAYQAGWSLVLLYGSGVIGYLLMAMGPSVWFRQTRMVTAADVIRLRFGPGMEQFYAYLQSCTAPLFGGIHLYSLAIFTTSLLGLDVRVAIVVLGVVVLFYTAMSGAWAVLAADFIKGLVLLPITIAVAVVCLVRLGGISGLLQHISAAGLQTAFAPVKSYETVAGLHNITAGYFTWGFITAYYCTQIIATNNFTTAGKFLAVKDGREARRASLLAAAALLVGMFIFFIPPMTARLLIPAEVAAMPLRNPTEGAYAAIAMYLLPSGLVALVLVGMCASTMSTLDSGLTNLASLITQNIYPALCRLFRLTPWEGRARLVLARVVNLLCALTIITCALVMERLGTGGVFNLMVNLVALVLAPVTVPMMWGMFVRRVPLWAAPVSIIVGLVVSFSIALVPKLLGTAPWYYHQQMFSVYAAGTLAFLGARLACRRDDPAVDAREAEYFSRRNRPVDFATEIGQGNDGRQMRIVGLFGLVMGAAILLLLLPASSAGHSGKILLISGSTATIGGVLMYFGYANRST